MLEQAIIDAEALRETALKNAEAQVIEKYSSEIKEAVENLLEQEEEDPLGGLGGDDQAADAPEAGLEGNMEKDAEALLDKTSAAAHDGENLCPCPDEKDVVTVDLDDLANKLSNKDDELEPHEVVAGQITDVDSPQDDKEELNYRLRSLEDKLGQLVGDMGQANVYQEGQDDDSFEFDLEGLVEKMVVDIDPTKLSGWAGRPESEIKRAEAEIAATLSDDDVKEEKEALAKAVKKLEGVNESLQGENNKLNERNEKLEDISIQLRDRLVESNMINARLLYTNKVLGSNSLNGRQKVKIVEAISKAESVEEAKTIYETLQSAVGESKNKNRRPESLSEAVNRRSSTILPRARKQKPNNPMTNRWKALAGITSEKD
jgi:hypothetical protein